MSDRVARKFNLSDGMTLVAATAVGLYVARAVIELDSRIARAGVLVEDVGIYSGRFVALSWTLAVLFLRFRAPRPRRRLLWRQPGVAACAAVCLSGSLNLGMSAISAFGKGWVSGSTFTAMDLLNFASRFAWPPVLAPGVMTAWMILMMGGRWRPEASWIDRIGRVLGLFWIASAILIVVLEP